MRIRRIFSFLLCLALALTMSTGIVISRAKAAVPTKTITDMAKRKLTVPANINKVFATSQLGTVFLYTLAPDKLAGLSFSFNEDEKKYVPKQYQKIPVLGAWSGKNGTGNIEAIIKEHPDVLISMGDIDKTAISSADRIQKQTGIPVVMVDGSLAKLEKAYKYVGDLIGEAKQAKTLGDYCNKVLTVTKAKVDKISEDKQVKVYYAEGPKGLETDPSGTLHSEVIDFVCGKNVADVKAKAGYGRSEVSLEQLIAWNPDVIITGYDKEANNGFFGAVYKDAGWADLKAVKEKKVYQIPSYPFDWFDRPPSVNRIIGVEWLANLLYPDVVKIDLKAEVKEFCSKFYHCKLTDKQVEELIKNAVPAK